MCSQIANTKRAGFTLLELLMVVAIIAILMGLSLKVMFGLLGQAEEQATIATVRKIDAMLQQKMEAFDRTYRGNRAEAAEATMVGILAGQNIYGVRSNVVETLARKAAFRTAFPQRMIELTAVPTETQLAVPGMADSFFKAVAEPGARLQQEKEGLPTDNASVRARATTNWNTRHTAETESAELLYYCVIVADSFGATAPGGDRFTEREVADTDNDGLPEFIDAWGNPLRFYRWPTRLIDYNAPTPFAPDITNLTDPTDLDPTLVDLNRRHILPAERQIANLHFQGLAPLPIAMPNGVTPRDMLLVDPDDPVGMLYSELERLNGRQDLNNDGDFNDPGEQGPKFADEYNELKYHTPETYHTPLIVSAGPDEELGIQDPTHFAEPTAGVYEFGNLAQLQGTTTASPAPSSTVLEMLYDNITNRNRRAGAKK